MSNKEHPPQTAQPDAFEQALHRALQRREPVPPDLTERLLAIADEARPKPLRAAESLATPQPLATPRPLTSPRRHVLSWPHLPSWAAAALAATLVLLVSLLGVSVAHVQQQHARARQATRNFELASRIEQQTLAHTRQQLREAGIQLDH